MRTAAGYGIHLLFEGVAVMAFAQAPTPQATPDRPGPPMPPGPNPNSQYRLGPDSMPQEAVPKGDIRGPYTLPSKVYPGRNDNRGMRNGAYDEKLDWFLQNVRLMKALEVR